MVDGLAHVKSRSQPPEDEEDLLKKLEDTTHVSLFNSIVTHLEPELKLYHCDKK